MSREVERPLTLVFVRHGYSYANKVQEAAKKGDFSGYTEKFRKIGNSEMPLIEEGIEQAKTAGLWIKENIQGGIFDEYYVSSFVRAIQTAGYLGLLPETKAWKYRDYLREQSFGHLDRMTDLERREKYPEIMANKEIDPNYWSGLGGESRADLTQRAKDGVNSLYRECVNGSGIIVTHGNTLWAFRTILEGLTWEQLAEIDSRDNPLEKMNNCQVVQYTRTDPGNSNKTEENFAWMRTVCPWDETLSRNDWVEIKRPKHSDKDLLKMAEARIEVIKDRWKL